MRRAIPSFSLRNAGGWKASYVPSRWRFRTAVLTGDWGPNADGYCTKLCLKAPGGNRFYGKTVAKWGRERAAKSIFLPAT